jgi:hypothetical protein
MRAFAMVVVLLVAVGATQGSTASSFKVFVPLTARSVSFDAGTPVPTTVAATATATVAATATAQPSATATSTAARINLQRLPMGDNKYSTTSAQVGYTFLCAVQTGGGGAFTDGPWINSSAGTWDSTGKAIVDGSRSWTSQFTTSSSGTNRVISGNGLPTHTTGTYPIASTDDAYSYDRNPNSISAQTVSYTLPKSPTYKSTPTCESGTVGILLTGSMLFNGLDAESHDAPAHEVQDACQGHPERTGQYHYHWVSTCTSDPGTGHSALVGYALDGFGVYGHRGESGETIINADLDVCHGHTHTITWDGVSTSMFHYHATWEYPYTVGCYRGTPVRAVRSRL